MSHRSESDKNYKDRRLKIHSIKLANRKVPSRESGVPGETLVKRSKTVEQTLFTFTHTTQRKAGAAFTTTGEEMEKADVIKQAMESLIKNDHKAAIDIINEKYPFVPRNRINRQVTLQEKMCVFVRDGFIDRYDGERLVNPGALRVLSIYYPNDFPYHPNNKMDAGHMAFWDLFPSIDHLVPISQGGVDQEQNWITTSMRNNSIKANWTMEEIGWTLSPPGRIEDWDGLTKAFLYMVDKDDQLKEHCYIRRMYRTSKRSMEMCFQ